MCLSLLVVGGAGRDLFRSTPPPPPPPLCFFILPSAPGNNIGECLACIIMMGVQPTVTGRRRDAPDVIEPSAEKTKKKGDTFFQLLDYFFISYMDERCHSKSWKKIGLCIPLIHGWEELWNVGIYQDIIWWRPVCYIDSTFSVGVFFPFWSARLVALPSILDRFIKGRSW